MARGEGEGEGKEKYTHHPRLAAAPILYWSSIQDGSIKNLIYYLVFRASKIMPALQANPSALLTERTSQLGADHRCKLAIYM